MSYEYGLNNGELGEFQYGRRLGVLFQDCSDCKAIRENDLSYGHDRNAVVEYGDNSHIDDPLVWGDSPQNSDEASRFAVFDTASSYVGLSPSFGISEPQLVLDRKHNISFGQAVPDENCESFVISIVRVASDNKLDHTPCGRLFVAHDRRLNSDSVFLGLEIHEISYRGAFSWAISKQGRPSRQSKSGD